MTHERQSTIWQCRSMRLAALLAAIAAVVAVLILATHAWSSGSGYLTSLSLGDARGIVLVGPGRSLQLGTGLFSLGWLVRLGLACLKGLARTWLWLLEARFMVIVAMAVGLGAHMSRRTWTHRKVQALLCHDRH